MFKHLHFFISLSLFFIQSQALAQKNTRLYEDSIFNKYADRGIQLYGYTKPYYIIQWRELIPGGIKFIRKIGERTGIIKVTSENVFDFLKQRIKISAANNSWKFSPALEKIIEKKNNDGIQKYILTGLSIDSLLSILSNKPKELIILNINKLSQSVIVKCNEKYLKEYVLPLKEVIFLDAYIEPQTEIGIIGYDRSYHGINALDYIIPGANGKSIVIGVKEQKMEEADLDLYKRVLSSPIAATSVTNHATVIASIIGGAGNSFYDGRGIANAAKFFPSSFANLFADDTAVLNMNKVTVQNHSYGTVIRQFYGAEAVSYDAHTWVDKNFVHVFSAGNEGLSPATDGIYAGIPGYANLTGNFKMAKNVVTVGSVDNKGNIPAESSVGPLYDGRVAPQLIALGPNGSSDAAAIVSGTVAVMQQVYADSNGQALPPASLTKAILYNCAEDIYNTGIDYKTGYGLLNSYASIKAIQQKKYDGGTLAQSQEWTKIIVIPTNIFQLKVTLAWTDSAATVNNNKAIINDLDLEVKELSRGIIYKPWVLNTSPHIDSLLKLPVRKRDSLNTAEQVTIQFPVAGDYEIRVVGTNILSPSLPFHIAYNADTLNTFRFLSPQHASDVNREENETLTIKWKTFVADSNQTGNLFTSYNNGANWELLQQSLKLHSNQLIWKTKDTSSVAVFKMETSFGTFFSKDFIISKVTRPVVDFICIDSFQLSWNKHVYANAYKIFALTDSPYLKPILTVADTFKVFKRADYPSLVYAIEPVLTNGLPAARSVALNIELQGVQCFYKTLNYNLLENNIVNLVLELSVTDYVDSIYFEKVSSVGQWQQTYGSAKVISNTIIYSQLVNNLASGITYFRGKIKLKGGGIVYTETISVLTSGQHQIVFYPNPAAGNNLNYVLQQGVPADIRLQLFDLTGRLLKDFSSLPDQIDISAFSSGILIYKLISRDNKILDKGKIMIIRK